MGNNASTYERCFAACASNDAPLVQKLLGELSDAAKAEVLEARDKQGRTLLYVAAARGHLKSASTVRGRLAPSHPTCELHVLSIAPA